MKCQHCKQAFRGKACPSCGWRLRPTVEKGTPEKVKRHWERVYGVPVKEHKEGPIR